MLRIQMWSTFGEYAEVTYDKFVLGQKVLKPGDKIGWNIKKIPNFLNQSPQKYCSRRLQQQQKYYIKKMGQFLFIYTLQQLTLKIVLRNLPYNWMMGMKLILVKSICFHAHAIDFYIPTPLLKLLKCGEIFFFAQQHHLWAQYQTSFLYDI